VKDGHRASPRPKENLVFPGFHFGCLFHLPYPP
jgi:hypothetical protein